MLNKSSDIDEIPNGVSMESASYIEKNNEILSDELQNKNTHLSHNNLEEEYTPKLFSEEHVEENTESTEIRENNENEQLFDQDVNEDEDFEIPAFLRRQKF